MRKAISLSFAILVVLILAGCSYSKTAQKTDVISQEEAKTKTQKFISENLVQPGTSVEIKEIAAEGTLYRIVAKISAKTGDQDVTVYLTQDGKKLFPQYMDIAEVEKQVEASKNKQAEADKEVPKTDKPEVNLYVMSFCPYGNKAEDTIKPVYNLLKDKVDFNFHYIVTVDGDNIQSLHGQKEVDQNEREACVLKNYSKDKWIDFVTYVNASCGSDGSCWEAGAKSLGIDTTKIASCVSSEGAALMKTDAEASNAAGASGSPTMVINGSETQTVYQYGNSEEYKKAICGAFNTAPTECSQELSSQTSTAEGGSCGD